MAGDTWGRKSYQEMPVWHVRSETLRAGLSTGCQPSLSLSVRQASILRVSSWWMARPQSKLKKGDDWKHRAGTQEVYRNNANKNTAITVQGNLDVKEDVNAIIKEVLDAFPSIDLLINNASTFYPTPIDDISEEHWEKLVGSNLKGPLFLIQGLKQKLKESTKNLPISGQNSR